MTLYIKTKYIKSNSTDSTHGASKRDRNEPVKKKQRLY